MKCRRPQVHPPRACLVTSSGIWPVPRGHQLPGRISGDPSLRRIGGVDTVTVTRQSVTSCELCGRPVAYKPGRASEALTAHFTAKHQRDLDGRRQAGQAGQAGQAWEPRTVRMLRALADTPGGLSAEALVDALAEGVTSRGVTPRDVAVRRYGSLLTHLAAAGEVKASGKGHGTKGRPVVLWRITGAGRRHLTAADAAPDRQGLLRDAREQFGPGTPTGIRRRAAVILRGAGYSPPQIGRVFGVGGGTIRTDLAQAGPVSPVPDPGPALGQLAARTEQVRQAQQALHEVRGEFGPGTPIRIRREVAAILSGLEMSYREIGLVFGVTAAPIGQDLRRYRPTATGTDPAAAIRKLAHQAQEAEQAAQE
jgi:hypothetical protein